MDRRGVALVVGLLLLTTLAILVVGAALLGRIDLRLARNRAEGALAEAAADGAAAALLQSLQDALRLEGTFPREAPTPVGGNVVVLAYEAAAEEVRFVLGAAVGGAQATREVFARRVPGRPPEPFRGALATQGDLSWAGGEVVGLDLRAAGTLQVTGIEPSLRAGATAAAGGSVCLVGTSPCPTGVDHAPLPAPDLDQLREELTGSSPPCGLRPGPGLVELADLEGVVVCPEEGSNLVLTGTCRDVTVLAGEGTEVRLEGRLEGRSSVLAARIELAPTSEAGAGTSLLALEQLTVAGAVGGAAEVGTLLVSGGPIQVATEASLRALLWAGGDLLLENVAGFYGSGVSHGELALMAVPRAVGGPWAGNDLLPGSGPPRIRVVALR